LYSIVARDTAVNSVMFERSQLRRTFWALNPSLHRPVRDSLKLLDHFIFAFALIPYPHRLALGARHLARCLDDDAAGHPDQGFEAALHLVGFRRAECGIIRRVGRALHLDGHGVERALAAEHDLVIGREAGEADQHRFDLGGIDVDPADDEHVVVAPGDAHDAQMGAPTGAWLVAEPGDIVGAVAGFILAL
jgi:hypothetical protein